MAASRPPGSVFFRQDTGKWIGRRRWTDELGHNRERSYTCQTEKEAWKKLRELEKEILTGTLRRLNEPTLGEWLDEVMESVFKPKVRPSTYDLYDGLIRNHIFSIAKVRLSQLTVDMIESLWANKTVTKQRKVGKKTEKDAVPMSRATKHQIRRFLINALNHAVRRRKLKENIAIHTLLVDPTTPKVVKALTAEQAKLLLDHVSSPVYRAVFGTQLMLGLRIGETLGMKWSDIEGNIVHIRQQIQRDRKTKQLVEQDLKTAKSRRTLPIPAPLLAVLEGLPRSSQYVFASKTATPLEPRNAQRELYNAAKKAGLEGVSTHVLRHTYATLNVTSGVPINVISVALGHTHLSTTMIYAEAQIDVIREANDKVSKLLAS